MNYALYVIAAMLSIRLFRAIGALARKASGGTQPTRPPVAPEILAIAVPITLALDAATAVVIVLAALRLS